MIEVHCSFNRKICCKSTLFLINTKKYFTFVLYFLFKIKNRVTENTDCISFGNRSMWIGVVRLCH